MRSLNVDPSKLNHKAKEAFANSLIDFGAGAARYASYVILVIPAAIFVKLIGDKDNVLAFLWNSPIVLFIFSLIFAGGMILGAYFRNEGIRLLNELPDCCNKENNGKQRT